MPDAIDKAQVVAEVKKNLQNIGNVAKATSATALQNASDTAKNLLNQQLENLQDKLPANLPLTKNPELLKKQIEALATQQFAEKKEMVLDELAAKEKEVKENLKKLAEEEFAKLVKLPNIQIPPIPMGVYPFDPRVLATVAMAKLRKELEEQRQKVSRENILKMADALEYPLSTKKLPSIPKIPDLPLKTTDIKTGIQSAVQKANTVVNKITNP